MKQPLSRGIHAIGLSHACWPLWLIPPGTQTRSFLATLNPADWPQQATNDGLNSSTTGEGSGDLLSQTIQNEAGKVSYNIDQLGR